MLDTLGLGFRVGVTVPGEDAGLAAVLSDA